MKEENLIFIVSQPRSGSTYLQNILSNNPQTNTISEPWIMLAFAPLLNNTLVENSSYDHQLAMKAFRDFCMKTNFDFKKKLKHHILNIYQPLFQKHDFFIDKTPRYWHIVDEIIQLFPTSKIIILQRNPLDVLKSIIQTWQINTIEHLHYFRNDILLAPKVLDDFILKNKTNPNIKSIYYSDLVQNKQQTIMTLYKYLGIPFTDKVLFTDNNHKYKGLYGDPYLNDKPKIKFEISPIFKKLILGYAHYLGKDYFKKHHFSSPKCMPTRSFDYFYQFEQNQKTPSLQSIKHQIFQYIHKKRLQYF